MSDSYIIDEKIVDEKVRDKKDFFSEFRSSLHSGSFFDEKFVPALLRSEPPANIRGLTEDTNYVIIESSPSNWDGANLYYLIPFVGTKFEFIDSMPGLEKALIFSYQVLGWNNIGVRLSSFYASDAEKVFRDFNSGAKKMLLRAYDENNGMPGIIWGTNGDRFLVYGSDSDVSLDRFFSDTAAYLHARNKALSGNATDGFLGRLSSRLGIANDRFDEARDRYQSDLANTLDVGMRDAKSTIEGLLKK